MNRLLISLGIAASLLGTIARANDTGYAGITVDAIKTNARAGTSFSFSGGEAVKFMETLPQVNNVAGPLVNLHNRTLHIFSPSFMLTLDCTDLEGYDTPLPARVDPKKVNCTITFDRKVDDFDTMEFVPPVYR